jgi:hypothetical protein
VRARLLPAQTLLLSARSLVNMNKTLLCVAVLALLCTGMSVGSLCGRYQRLILQHRRTGKQQQMGTVGDPLESACPSEPAIAH